MLKANCGCDFRGDSCEEGGISIFRGEAGRPPIAFPEANCSCDFRGDSNEGEGEGDPTWPLTVDTAVTLDEEEEEGILNSAGRTTRLFR